MFLAWTQLPALQMAGYRPDFWREKIKKNRANDLKASEALIVNGWRVGVVLVCAMRGAGENIEQSAQDLANWLRSDAVLMEKRG